MIYSKKLRKNLIKFSKKLPTISKIIFVLCFIVGFGGGVLLYSFICKDDKFVILGETSIALDLNQSYTFVDKGVSIISFGRDISDMVKIKTNIPMIAGQYQIDTSTVTEYYLIYTVDDIKYGNVSRVRVITVGESA